MSEIPKMIQTMRWFGPHDPVSLEYIRMAGASGIVTSLHHIDDGRVWGTGEIQKRKETIESHGLTWNVVESLTPHDDIKLRTGDYQRYLQNYCTTLRHLGACGVQTVCYNFMTLLDWMRTDLYLPFQDGSLALAFNWKDLAVFDVYVVKRKDAEKDYAHLFPEGLDDYYKSMSKTKLSTLTGNILKGLPGTDQSWTPEDFNRLSERFRSVSRERLRENLIEFLRVVVPIAEEAGVRLAIHPDDPPYALFGVPRIVGSEADLALILSAVDSPSNGFTLCTGSFGVNPRNDLPGMVERNGERMHFIHLRNITKDSVGNFHEANHLDGDVNMSHVVLNIMKVMKQRKEAIPMRPDHGHLMMFEMEKGESIYPGYSLLGRMRGLAELRGLEIGLNSVITGSI
jgi:mannonate dehydratase